jgi:3',5'-cyclic AMP phosphodiesterase CpdA
MSVSINWIHVSDLHFGLDRNSWLWPTVKHRVLQDLETTISRIGKIDLVFFTGDLVQSGSAEEFDRLNRELEEFWGVLGKHGAAPRLCVVPGNHDLARPPIDLAITKALTQLWPSDHQLQRQFWGSEDSEYRNAIVQFFVPYTNWSRDLSVPTLSIKSGILPGDFSGTYEKGEVKLGVIGLNSTFLQIADGDFKGKLDLHISQLNAVCDGDPERWLSARIAAVFLTHQPPSWLSTGALDHYRQEIYPSGRFIAHLCGHQHEPESSEISEAGAPPRRLRQAPSLFGLSSWRGVHPTKRTHGYNAGQFVFQTSDGLEKLWPKVAVAGRDGTLNLAPDHTYKLKDDCVATLFEIRSVADDREPSLPASGIDGTKLRVPLIPEDVSFLNLNRRRKRRERA